MVETNHLRGGGENLVKVTKRDGRTEGFVIEKVVVSMVKSGAPADVAREIARTD